MVFTTDGVDVKVHELTGFCEYGVKIAAFVKHDLVGKTEAQHNYKQCLSVSS